MISPTVLGRKAAEYRRLGQAGKSAESIAERQKDDADVEGIPFDEYLSMLAPYGESKQRKLEARRSKRETVMARHLSICSFLNDVVLNGTTDLAQFQTALKELGAEADDWVLMTAARKDETSGEILFTTNDSGWENNGRANRYADRPQMVGKAGKVVLCPFPIREPEAVAPEEPESE